MGQLERLAGWRKSMEEGARHEGSPPPTDEAVLGQYVYSEIAEFIEEQWDALAEALTNPDPPQTYEDLAVAWSHRE